MSFILGQKGLSGLSSKRGLIGIGIICVVVLALISLAVPSANPRLSGSSYNRAPDGYGAWFAYMADRGTPLERWQKPFESLPPDQSATLVRVGNELLNSDLSPGEIAWVNEGNHLVLLGVRGRVTGADFRTVQTSEAGAVTIETRRRRAAPDSRADQVLGDTFGAIAWRQSEGAGDILFIVPPYLGANAYQEEPGNFEFLAQQVAMGGDRLLIDEYIHGFKDADVIVEEVAGSVGEYLAKTPFMPALVQIALVLLIIIWAANRRIRPPVSLAVPTSNNSRAYIEALASILEKAENRDFVIEAIGREEQRQVQRALGLGDEPVAPDRLLLAWQQQMGKPATELSRIFKPYWNQQRLSETELKQWVEALRSLHRQLNLRR